MVSPRPVRAVVVSLFAISAVEAFRLPPGYRGKDLFERANDACPTNSNLTQCGQGLPDTFCCDLSATRCVVIANGTGALCCPNRADGSRGDCQTMSPIDGGCDADAYNATLFPTSPIHLTEIPSSFTPCGSNEDGVCCPPTFDCTDGKCVSQDKRLAAGNGTAAASSTAPAVSLSSAHPTVASTSDAQQAPGAASSKGDPSSTGTTTQFPPLAILVGLFPGIIAGALLSVAVMVCLGRHRKRHHRRHRRRHHHHHHRKVTDDDDGASDTGPIRAAQVSDPIYHDDGAGRVDFLRRNTQSRAHSSKGEGEGEHSPGRSPALSRVRSLFSRRSAAATVTSPHHHHHHHGLGMGLDTPHTPHRSPKREPSMESITIFSPPDMRAVGGAGAGAGDRTTTYSDVLRAAGANPHHDPLPGAAYAGSPGIVDPRRRGVDDGHLR